MASKRRFDVCAPRPKYGKEGEIWWHRVGSAYENDKGQITLFLDSVPAPDPERGFTMTLFEQTEEREQQRRGSSAPKRRAPAGRGADDEIPF